MQKLPEASDRNRNDAYAKKKDRLKGGISFSFSSDQWSDNTLLTGGRCHAFVFRWCIG